MRLFTSALLPLVAVFFLCSSPGISASLHMEELYPFADNFNVSWTIVTDPNVSGGTWMLVTDPSKGSETPVKSFGMTYQDAQNWVASLNSTKYGGFNDWHLPMTPDWTTWGYDNNDYSTKIKVTVSDLGYLYYEMLQLDPIDLGAAPNNYTDLKLSILNPELLHYNYWFGNLSEYTEEGNPLEFGWIFDFKYGTQFLAGTSTSAYALAIRKTTPIPEPTSALLFLTGITGLGLMRRR
ncbi:PEP-CTERM sorting domain-containing protein [Desulfobulbus alkaliphilus]|uniref:PEP-CTERM sorting domain-containing protein n=1 Tax=Desulfobulbus alkaliphilus TaxID=869814 RepID=UPI001964BBFC|nr:PEP-CTERM sorting domain-containing protein [Desulfobulbus alkaliphilus]MBM9538865.1 PEP-CTERM sorting domain-containing protein [Desulfobulbus alkaliphilus]